MAEYTTLGITFTRKENMGDFNSVEISSTGYVKLEPEDDEEFEWEVLYRKLENNVNQALQHYIDGSGYAKEMQKQRERQRSKVLETGIAQYTHLGKPTGRKTVVIGNNDKPSPTQPKSTNQLDDIEF